MKCRHDRHIQSRQQRQDIRTGIAAENSELMLERHDIEVSGVEHIGGVRVVLQLLIVDLDSHDRGILVALPDVIHRDDERLRGGTRQRHRVLQIVGERRDSAATWERVPDECKTDGWDHNRTSRGG